MNLQYRHIVRPSSLPCGPHLVDWNLYWKRERLFLFLLGIRAQLIVHCKLHNKLIDLTLDAGRLLYLWLYKPFNTLLLQNI